MAPRRHCLLCRGLSPEESLLALSEKNSISHLIPRGT
jgi:hypothetical protein